MMKINIDIENKHDHVQNLWNYLRLVKQIEAQISRERKLIREAISTTQILDKNEKQILLQMHVRKYSMRWIAERHHMSQLTVREIADKAGKKLSIELENIYKYEKN